MKKLFLIATVLPCIYSCSLPSLNKKADYLQVILAIKSDLKIIKETSDSIKNALTQTNATLLQNTTSISTYQKTIDSIKLQLTSVSTQIKNLTSQLNTDSADISNIKSQLLILNQKYIDLITKLNDCCTPVNLTNDLVAFYPFTGNTNDSSGNENHGIAYNVTQVADRNGNTNSAYQFDGYQNSYIDCGNTSSLRAIKDTMSISLWFKASGGTISPRIIDFGNGLDGFAEYSIIIEPISGNDYKLMASYRNVTTSTNIKTDNWYHVVLNISKNKGDLYLNGTLINSIKGTTSSLSFPYRNGNLNIGRMNHVAFDAFSGIIDDIRIYKRNLSTTEIEYLYKH